jgi:hypothetical protein
MSLYFDKVLRRILTTIDRAAGFESAGILYHGALGLEVLFKTAS